MVDEITYDAWVDELQEQVDKETKLQRVLDEYYLDDMLDMLNDKCGNGKPLTLNEKQAIRFMIEELNRVMKGIV